MNSPAKIPQAVTGPPVPRIDHEARINHDNPRPNAANGTKGRRGDATTHPRPRLPRASRQWNFAMEDGDLFKGGFGGQGLYVSPGRDLVIAFAGTPRADGSSNLLR